MLGQISPREVRKLQKDMNIYNAFGKPAPVGNSKTHGINENIRKSTVVFPKVREFPKTFKILQSIVLNDYHGITNHLDLSNIAEVQYAKYTEGDFFKKHRDVISHTDKHMTLRSLTCSINLSEPEDYEGGELVVYDEEDNIIAQLEKEVGSYIIFPAFIQHEAKVVKSGVREAIVTWSHDDRNSLDKFKKEVYS